MRRKHSAFGVFLCCVLAVPTTAMLASGLVPVPEGANLREWLAVGTVLGILHVFLRPVLRLIGAPVGCLTLGLSGWVIDVGLILLSARLVDGFPDPPLLYAVLTALLINGVCSVL